MPVSRVIPKRLPVHPGKDSRFTIRRISGEWWVHYDVPHGIPIPADSPHCELVNLVNELKEAEGCEPGGAFSINEHFQVIARMKAPAGYQQNAIHVVDISSGVIRRYAEAITFQEGAIDPTASPAEGSPWTGPRCGATYSFAAPESRKAPSHNLDEVWTDIEGTINLLSTHASGVSYPPSSGLLATFLAALRRQLPQGGRFRVNEHGRAFTSDEDRNVFIGNVPLSSWFPPLTLSAF